MIRRTAATTAATLTALAAIGACTNHDATSNAADTTTTQTSGTTTAPTSDEPIDLGQIPDGTPLEPGTYSVGLLSDDGPTRASSTSPRATNPSSAARSSDQTPATWPSGAR
jgi:hypothetical protein